jgi:uncharacterized protein (DUF2267 family)
MMTVSRLFNKIPEPAFGESEKDFFFRVRKEMNDEPTMELMECCKLKFRQDGIRHLISKIENEDGVEHPYQREQALKEAVVILLKTQYHL